MRFDFSLQHLPKQRKCIAKIMSLTVSSIYEIPKLDTWVRTCIEQVTSTIKIPINSIAPHNSSGIKRVIEKVGLDNQSMQLLGY